MNRYTYKAKRKDNGEWIEGCYVYEEYGNRHYITLQLKNSHQLIEIIPETICQCTNLKDIEGNYIFENDIVKYVYEPNDSGFRANEKGIITYKNTGFHYETIKGTNKYGSRSGWLPSIPNDDGKLFKIIGNKFDEVEE